MARVQDMCRPYEYHSGRDQRYSVMDVGQTVVWDPLRGWRALDETGTSYWWYSIARNKKSVTANLRSEEGRAVVRKLIQSADVVIENFRPGTMEKWGLGPDDFDMNAEGVPVLHDCLARFECTTWANYAGGDHDNVQQCYS